MIHAPKARVRWRETFCWTPDFLPPCGFGSGVRFGQLKDPRKPAKRGAPASAPYPVWLSEQLEDLYLEAHPEPAVPRACARGAGWVAAHRRVLHHLEP